MRLDPFDLCLATVGDDPGVPAKSHRPVVVVSSSEGIRTGFVVVASGTSQVRRYGRAKYSPLLVIRPEDYPELLDRPTALLPFRLATVPIGGFETTETGQIIKTKLNDDHRLALEQGLRKYLV